MTPGQNKRIHALLGKAGLMDEKAALVKEYTNGRSESSKDLSELEAKGLIWHLERLVPATKAAPSSEQVSMMAMRRKVFALGYNLGWIDKADGGAFNALVLAGVAKKLKTNRPGVLNHYSATELRELITQLDQVLVHNQQAAHNAALREVLSEIGVEMKTKKTVKK
jgi:hypothetical protein